MPPHRRAATLLLTLAGAASLAAGCGELGTESLVVSGTYQLIKVNNSDVPTMAYSVGGNSLEITGGTLRFDPDSARGVDGRRYRCPACDPAVDDPSPRAFTQGYMMIAGNAVVLSQRLADGTVMSDTGVVTPDQLIFHARWLGSSVGDTPIRATAVYVKQ
jgi:hypothetical protein